MKSIVPLGKVAISGPSKQKTRSMAGVGCGLSPIKKPAEAGWLLLVTGYLSAQMLNLWMLPYSFALSSPSETDIASPCGSVVNCS
ncbi:hypothetical protein [Azonexus sp. IMCC34839]|uniref:hypothetical protein n=1 Tax=Azonexus sp. IMCC34839 TaxID=3133695 RepID=UPI0039994A6D